MAKTKRRSSCKGRRRSLKRGGGPNDSYENAFNIPYRASSTKRGFSSGVKGVSRLGWDTKQEPVPTLTIQEMLEILHRQSGYFKDKFDDTMKPFMRNVGAARDSTASAVGRAVSAVGRAASAVRDLPDRTASAVGRAASTARRVRASILRAIGVHSDHLDESKLVPVTQNMLSGYEKYEQGLVIKHYYYTSDGKFYNSLHHAGPVGIWPDRTNIMTAQFLSGHEPKVGQTWAITRLRL